MRLAAVLAVVAAASGMGCSQHQPAAKTAARSGLPAVASLGSGKDRILLAQAGAPSPTGSAPAKAAATPTPTAAATVSPGPTPAVTPAATPAASPTPRNPSEVDTASLPKEALKPIDIDADVFEVNAKERKGVFRGNVVARQGDVTIRATRVEAMYSKQANAIVKAVAEGGVTVTSGTKVAKADRAAFNNDQRTIVLSGEPRLWEEGSLLEGREIIFHVDDGRVECFECSIDLDPTRLQEMQDDVPRGPSAPVPGGPR